MRVLLAGPSGVLGRPTVRRLVAAGHQVIGLVRDEARTELVRALGAEPVRGDVLDADAVLRAAEGAEAVIHLATALPTGFSQSKQAWQENDRRRIEGTRNLLQAARSGGAQVYVQESLHYVYGDHGESWVHEEIEPARTKITTSALEAEAVALGANSDRLATVVLRFGTVYDREAWHTQLLISQARKRQLPVVGDGKGFWSLIHAQDAAQATVRALEDAPGGSVYNVADDEPVRMVDFFSYLADRLGAGPPHRVPALAARAFAGKELVSLLTGSIRLSNRLIIEELGFTPHYRSYREGLDEILAETVPEPV